MRYHSFQAKNRTLQVILVGDDFSSAEIEAVEQYIAKELGGLSEPSSSTPLCRKSGTCIILYTASATLPKVDSCLPPLPDSK